MQEESTEKRVRVGTYSVLFSKDDKTDNDNSTK